MEERFAQNNFYSQWPLKIRANIGGMQRKIVNLA